MKVYELLARPENWCQGEYAKDANGERVEPSSPDACRWCLRGAVAKVYGEPFGRGGPVTDKLFGRVPSITGFNDAPATTYEDVIALCKELDV